LQVKQLEDVTENKKVTLAVVVLQNSPMKSILVKHGLNTGNNINLASILVGDQSEFYITISFWDDHAYWVKELQVGDIIILTNAVFSTNKNRKIGKTSKSSILYNFGTPPLKFNIQGKNKLHIFISIEYTFF